MADTLRIKRRLAAGGAGTPASLANAELAYNEASHTLYYGEGTGGSGGTATSVVPIAGPGAFLPLNGGIINSALGGWSSFNYGKQLLLTGGGTNPALGITDNTGANLIGITNAAGVLRIADMPAYANSTTAPVNLLSLDGAGSTSHTPWTFASTTTQTGAATFSSTVTLALDPALPLQAVTKQYADRQVATVATIAALRTATTATLPVADVQVRSYAGTGVRGGGRFIYVSTDTTTADNGGTVIVDASNRRWYRDLRDSALNVTWFGAAGDGVADDTAEIQATYTAVPTTGGAVEFPAGIYLISAAITLAISNVITYGNNSEIRTNSLTADHFTASANVNRIVFYNLSLWATVAKTAGACFRGLLNNSNWNFYNVQCGSLDNYQAAGNVHRLWNGWDFSRGHFRIEIDVACVGICKNVGCILAADLTTGSAAEVSFDGRFLFCLIAIYISGGCGGVYMNGEISVCGKGVLIDKLTTNLTNREIFFEERAIVDSCADYSLQAMDNSVAILDVNGSWFTSAGQVIAGQGVGMYLGSNAVVTPYGIAKISGARFYNNKVAGVVAAGMSMLCASSMFNNNATGMILEDTGANGSMVVGNQFMNHSVAGLTIQNGINQYSIQTNYFYSNIVNISGDSTVAFTPAASIASSNTGFPSHVYGMNVMAAGTSSVTFNHGCVYIPNFVQITTNDPAHTFAVGAVTQTSLTINANANVSANVACYWEVGMSVGANP